MRGATREVLLRTLRSFGSRGSFVAESAPQDDYGRRRQLQGRKLLGWQPLGWRLLVRQLKGGKRVGAEDDSAPCSTLGSTFGSAPCSVCSAIGRGRPFCRPFPAVLNWILLPAVWTGCVTDSEAACAACWYAAQGGPYSAAVSSPDLCAPGRLYWKAGDCFHFPDGGSRCYWRAAGHCHLPEDGFRRFPVRDSRVTPAKPCALKEACH